MSVVFDVEGIVIGDRAKLEQIAERYLNDQEAKDMNYSLEAKINEDGNLEFTAQGVGRQFQTPDVENVIERYLDNDVECYKLWGCTDGCWDQYTNDTEGRFYKQWYVEDFANKAKKVFFDDYEEAKSYAMNIIKNDPEYVANLEESGMDEEEFFDENFLDYLVFNQEPIKIVNITRVNYEDVVNTDIYNEDIPTTEKGNYIGKYQNLVIPIDFHDKIVDVEYFYPDNLSLLDDNSSFCCVEDSMSIMDWYPEITGYLVRFVDEQNFKIEKGKSIGMIFENFEDAQTKLASMENNDSSSSDFQQNEDDLESPFVMDHQDLESPSSVNVVIDQDLESPFSVNVVIDQSEESNNDDIEVDNLKYVDGDNFYFVYFYTRDGVLKVFNRHYIFLKSVGAYLRMRGDAIECSADAIKNCIGVDNYADMASKLSEKFSIQSFVSEMKSYLDANGVQYEVLDINDMDNASPSPQVFSPEHYVMMVNEYMNETQMINVSACIDDDLFRLFERKQKFEGAQVCPLVFTGRMLECNPNEVKNAFNATDYADMMKKIGDQFKSQSAFDDLKTFLENNNVNCQRGDMNDWDFYHDLF